MDSGHEVVLVDVNLVATTNGINGTHEELPEMKTRSKVAGGDAAAEPKIRLTRTAAAHADKEGSDSEKKDKKKNLRSGGGDADEAGAKSAKETTAGAKQTTGAVSASASKAPAPTAPTPAAKKKAPERDDDSGINSRASSVSNEDAATPARMRTRSSRASELASTSTPANRRGGAARVPLSIYEYEAVSFDDDLPLAATFKSSAQSAHKRKAVVYIEEMEEEEEEEAAQEGAEPAPKRRAAFLVTAGAGVVASLLYPWRKLRSGIAAIRPFKAPSVAVEAAAEHEEPKGADGAVAADAADTAPALAEAAQSSDQPVTDAAADTCSLM